MIIAATASSSGRMDDDAHLVIDMMFSVLFSCTINRSDKIIQTQRMPNQMPTMMQMVPSKQVRSKMQRMPNECQMPSGKCEAYILSLSQLSLSHCARKNLNSEAEMVTTLLSIAT